MLEQERAIEKVPLSVKQAIRRVVKDRGPWPLVLYGPPGTGKTCAGLCMLDYAGGLYWTAGELAKLLIEAMHGRAFMQTGRVLYPSQVWAEIATTSLVVLDELGVRDKVSDHSYEVVKGVLDARVSRPLVCISNLGPVELASKYDVRVTSRLAAGTILCVEGPDRRLSR